MAGFFSGVNLVRNLSYAPAPAAGAGLGVRAVTGEGSEGRPEGTVPASRLFLSTPEQ